MHFFKTSGFSATAYFAKPGLRLRLFSSVLLALYGSRLASALVISRNVDSAAANSSNWRISGTRDADMQQAALAKRADNARFTFYETGLGACGGWNLPTDFIVALNEAQWDGGSHCWEQITITHEGKSTQAQIVDLCPGCPWGALDMSPGLFGFFASQDLGVIYGAWDYGAGQAPPPVPSPSPSLPPPPPAPEPQTQLQSQPPPLPSLPSLPIPVPLPSTSQSSQTPQLTSTTSSSVSTISSTSVGATTTQGLQATEVAPLSATQTQNVQDDDDDDVTESLFYDYLSGDGSEANNLQALNLALINMVRAIVHQDSTSSTSPYPTAT